MDLISLDTWLENYGLAWTTRNAQAAADLYTDDGTYQITPFVEPMRGCQAILDYWTKVARLQRSLPLPPRMVAQRPALSMPPVRQIVRGPQCRAIDRPRLRSRMYTAPCLPWELRLRWTNRQPQGEVW